jgi:hypothetical protein
MIKDDNKLLAFVKAVASLNTLDEIVKKPTYLIDLDLDEIISEARKLIKEVNNVRQK